MQYKIIGRGLIIGLGSLIMAHTEMHCLVLHGAMYMMALASLAYGSEVLALSRLHLSELVF